MFRRALRLVLVALAAIPTFQAAEAQSGGKRKNDKTPPPAAAPAPKVTAFAGKLEAARALAKERNVPVLIHVLLEAEDSSDRYRDEVLPEKELIAASQKALVIYSNNGSHEKKTIEVVEAGEKRRKEVCSKYEVDSCAHHQVTWDEIWGEFKEETGELKCPQTIILGPDGKVAQRINTSNTPQAGEIIGLLGETIAKFGPGLDDAELALVKRELEQGRALTIAKSWPDAWKAWAAVLAITQKSPYAEEAAREQPKALAAMRAQLEEVAALLVPGTAAKAFAQLGTLQKSFAGTPLEKELAERLKKAEATKTIREEIAAYKLGLEADKMLAEARDLFDAKQDKKAERLVKKLLSKRYAATEAAKIARELWPHVTADEEKPPAK